MCTVPPIILLRQCPKIIGRLVTFSIFDRKVCKINFAVTTWVNSSINAPKSVFGQYSAPDPAWGWGAYNAPHTLASQLRRGKLKSSLFLSFHALVAIASIIRPIHLYYVARFNDMLTRSAITPPELNDLDEIWGTPSTLFGTDPGRFWARSAQKRERESLRKFCFFVR